LSSFLVANNSSKYFGKGVTAMTDKKAAQTIAQAIKLRQAAVESGENFYYTDKERQAISQLLASRQTFGKEISAFLAEQKERSLY
jgi:hypothetical protein